MKLLEFFQSQYPDKTIDQVLEDPDVGLMLSKVDVMGKRVRSTGAYASAYENKTDSSSIFKIGKTDNHGYGLPTKDGYLNYINRIKNMRLPVFPQIHSIEIFQHQDKQYSSYGPVYCYKINMERLYNVGDLNEKEHEFLLHRLLGRELTTQERQTLVMNNNLLPWFYTDILQSLAWNGKVEQAGGITLNLKISDIHDRYLQTALTAIKSVKKVKKASMDLHSGNVMYRRTPYGVQPVITDPLS
jgi:hypothetical protein